MGKEKELWRRSERKDTQARYLDVRQIVKMSDRMKDRITVRFPAELRRRLKAAAERSGTRESDLIREAVDRQLAAEDVEVTAYARAKKAGLIGVVRGARRDLSTNPRRFAGFGDF
ncbi:MAG: ribbon-helix-helix domain-containing protein [Acidobacteriia bacterium]|nr:ribbon-helix-helix domain-containing protein [Terriglobia bacterium]